MSEYMVVIGASVIALENVVRGYLKKGWKLQGGVAVDTANHAYQAMVR